jgi:hypothetical protein
LCFTLSLFCFHEMNDSPSPELFVTGEWSGGSLQKFSRFSTTSISILFRRKNIPELKFYAHQMLKYHSKVVLNQRWEMSPPGDAERGHAGKPNKRTHHSSRLTEENTRTSSSAEVHYFGVSSCFPTFPPLFSLGLKCVVCSWFGTNGTTKGVKSPLK